MYHPFLSYQNKNLFKLYINYSLRRQVLVIIWHSMRDANFRYNHCLICKLWAHPRLVSCTGLWCQQNERRLLTFYLPKLLLVGPVWLCAVLMATWQKYNEHLDPTYSYQLDTSYFYVCIVDNSFLWITQSY